MKRVIPSHPSSYEMSCPASGERRRQNIECSATLLARSSCINNSEVRCLGAGGGDLIGGAAALIRVGRNILPGGTSGGLISFLAESQSEAEVTTTGSEYQMEQLTSEEPLLITEALRGPRLVIWSPFSAVCEVAWPGVMWLFSRPAGRAGWPTAQHSPAH